MAANEVVKRNTSGMQVIKTLHTLLENDYTMVELIEKLNEKAIYSLIENSDFQNSSTFVKSQLKRAVSLYLEFSTEQEKV